MFVTLTCKRRVRSTKLGHTKLNSFLNVVRKRYDGYLWVLQPHKSGSIHYHLLIPVDFNCHRGTDLDAWSEKFYLCEVVWGVKPKVAEPPPVTCPFPRRRYNDPDFQPHPGLYGPGRNNNGVSAPP